MNISGQINYRYYNKNLYLQKQNKHVAFKNNTLAPIAEMSVKKGHASALKKAVLAFVSMLTVTTGFAKNSNIDIKSKKVEQLGLSQEQIIELDKLDGEDKKIRSDVFAVAEAYKNGKFAVGSKTRAKLLKKMNSQERAAFNLLTAPRELKNRKGNLITEFIDANCDGKAEYVQEYQFDNNNMLIDVVNRNVY